MSAFTVKRILPWLLALPIGLSLIACGAREPEPPAGTGENQPAPAATVQIPQKTVPATVGATETAAPASDAWANVQQSGRLRIGISADYPPFAFYDEEFEPVGYDIALGRSLGERLGVEVEFKDMAFDGLGGALQVDQIDAAIAAISVTDERRAVMDFSNIYYAGDGAALARPDSGIVIASVDDLAPWRVAVQDGTVYQVWLEEAVVATGIMPADNLLIYEDTAEAIDDLRGGLIDVVVADTLPLEFVARDGSLVLVGRELNRQRFAIAVARGSTLLSPINEALFELQNEGELARLAELYLSVDQAGLQPLPPAEPPTESQVGAQTLTPGCIDAMTLVAHLSHGDDGMRNPPSMAPGTPFRKSWRIQNNGTCPWAAGYMLTPIGGNVPQAGMSGVATALQRTVQPGESYDMTVDLVSPQLPGVYQGFWSMRSPSGLLFGDRIWVGIAVTAQPTPTPPPTVAPTSDISFVADRTAIRAGECVQFSWSVSNAAAIQFYAQGQSPEQNQVAPNGRRQECPPVTMFYNLQVETLAGQSEIRSIRIDVTAAPASGTPLINSFSVTPNGQIVAGRCVDVRWRVSGDISNVRVTRNDAVLWNGAPLSGTSRDCPGVGEMTYAIEVTGPGGTSRAMESVTVTPSPGASQPTPTAPANRLPVINSFTVLPNTIFMGNCLIVSWNVSGNVNRVQLRRNNTIVVDFAQSNSNVTECLQLEGTYVYRLDAFNAQGESVMQQVIATVLR